MGILCSLLGCHPAFLPATETSVFTLTSEIARLMLTQGLPEVTSIAEGV